MDVDELGLVLGSWRGVGRTVSGLLHWSVLLDGDGEVRSRRRYKGRYKESGGALLSGLVMFRRLCSLFFFFVFGQCHLSLR